MPKIVLIDISNSVGISGVGRYLQCLTNGIHKNAVFEFYWIHLLTSRDMLFHKVEESENGLTKITIPMPEYAGNVITHEYFMGGYCDIVWDIVSPYFSDKDQVILHLHTINTISLALKIKSELKSVKIITHLHCIPWKNKLNNDTYEFNKLYKKYYTNKTKRFTKDDFVVNFTEQISYNKSDSVICVTECARDFLIRAMGVDKHKISVIGNGMKDVEPQVRRFRQRSKRVKLLFVGAVIPSKGIEFILEAMDILHKHGVETELRVAGIGSPFYIEMLKNENKHLCVKFMGKLSFEELSRQYLLCDIGLMVSLQEQCSYAAIEMAMFGMPTIVTSVDGLDEMFSAREDCIKVETIFDKQGLRVNTTMLADSIELLKNSIKLQKLLSKNARALFLRKFQIDDMIKFTMRMYENTVN